MEPGKDDGKAKPEHREEIYKGDHLQKLYKARLWRAGPHFPLLLGTKVEIDLCDPKVWRYMPLVLMPGQQRQIDLCDLKAW